MTLELHRKGVFTWREWADTLAHELADASERGHPDDSTHYYEHWLAALEKLVAAKKVVPLAEMACRIGEWDNAARMTPHGKPIELPPRQGKSSPV